MCYLVQEIKHRNTDYFIFSFGRYSTQFSGQVYVILLLKKQKLCITYVIHSFCLICHRVALSIFEPPALFRSGVVKNSTSFRTHYSRSMEGGQEVISAGLLPLSVCVTPVVYLSVPFSNVSSATSSSKFVTT